jgi:integrase
LLQHICLLLAQSRHYAPTANSVGYRDWTFDFPFLLPVQFGVITEVFHLRAQDFAIELERRLVVVLDPHRRAEVDAEVEGVVRGEPERGADGNLTRRNFLAVDLQHDFERTGWLALQADYSWSVLARVISWGVDRGLADANPCKSGGRLYRGTRADKVWTADDEALFLERAPKHLHLPLLLALWTGQRQGDLLRLPWSAYDGEYIRLRQSKGGRRIEIRVGAPLKAALDATPKRSTIILVNSEGKTWTPDGFRASWGKAQRKAGIVGLTFHDLRGTAVTRLAIVECTEAEIAYITGHSLRSVRAILDVHYLHRDRALGDAAITKLERGTKVSN